MPNMEGMVPRTGIVRTRKLGTICTHVDLSRVIYGVIYKQNRVRHSDTNKVWQMSGRTIAECQVMAALAAGK